MARNNPAPPRHLATVKDNCHNRLTTEAQRNEKKRACLSASKVSPYGTVKMSSGEMTMVLEKVLSNETTHIKGEPQKMDMQRPQF